MENNKYILPLAILVAGVMVAGAIYFGTSGTPTPGEVPETQQSTGITIPPVTESDHITGNRDAEIIIVEYSDTECSWCKVFHETMHQIVIKYGGKVAWVYRHMPFHNQSIKEAQATECAYEIGGNDAFWKYLDRIFKITPSNDEFDLGQLPIIASDIELNTSSFNECISSQRYVENITKNLDLARPGNIEGTPYSIIISKNEQSAYINGAEPFEMVKAKIDSLIQN
ncbi:MAG: thioredoxin domain-containing protein [bacterium]